MCLNELNKNNVAETCQQQLGQNTLIICFSSTFVQKMMWEGGILFFYFLTKMLEKPNNFQKFLTFSMHSNQSTNIMVPNDSQIKLIIENV